MNITFKNKIKKNDIADIRRITEETGFFNAEEINIAEELAEASYKDGEEKSGYSFILAVDTNENKTIGYSCHGRIPCTESSYDLYWIVTDSKKRGKGIGSLVLKEAEKNIRNNGGTSIYIETSSKELYLPTRSFYTKNNYFLAAEFKDFYAPNDNKLIYVKYLS